MGCVSLVNILHALEQRKYKVVPSREPLVAALAGAKTGLFSFFTAFKESHIFTVR